MIEVEWFRAGDRWNQKCFPAAHRLDILQELSISGQFTGASDIVKTSVEPCDFSEF